ncbi:MAG: hypothetical protein JSV04_15175 [Candidatus Heimdallarchaeota archaeon]|nr:MAG: hypothetical protein JSV04_15175 [Candidatus Heimdallarchaeota archaeon]
MSSPSSPDIRKYGLEFINDLAQDRKEAVQSLGVAFSALKTEIRESAILTRSEEFQFVDDLMKHFREEVNRNFESQLTRITIKSLGWIKRVLMGEKILVKDESREEELQQIINDLSQQLKTKSAELSRIQPKIQTLEDQLKNKENSIQELKSTHMKQVQDLQQQILSEKNRADNISVQHKNLQEELFDFQLELEEQIKQTSTLKEQNTQLDMDLVAAKGEISRLTSSLEQARSAVSESEEDVSAAMEQWTISYQQQEEYFQQNLKETKEQYEEMIKTKLAESAEQHQRELNQLNEKLSERDSRVQDYQDQISELKMENQDLSTKKDEIELQMDQLSQKVEESEKVVVQQNQQIEQLETELEESREKAKESERKKLHLKEIQLSQVSSRADWLEQCLSYSNFAPMTILLRMGDEMDLDSLAKSVGMDPIVLDNQLQMLVRRDLIDIGRDGMIRANIPSIVVEEEKDSKPNKD